jgi:hypothetical protein
MATIKEALIQQLNLPVTFDAKGKPVTLLDFVKGVPSLSQSSLTHSQRAKLTAERIRREPEAEIATIGSGMINKERAIAEIEAQSPIGEVLVEAEQRLINRLIKEAESGRLKEIIHE